MKWQFHFFVFMVFLLLIGCASSLKKDTQKIGNFPESQRSEMVSLNPESTFQMNASIVRKRIGEAMITMYGYNGEIPGPILRVKQNTRVWVNFTNDLDKPTTVHWHGVRLKNAFDGTPGLTQAPIKPGESFLYELTFPDEGVYWYHSHLREDMQQELGLYGNILVEPDHKNYYNPVDKEEVIILDDILLLGSGPPEAFFEDRSTHSLMGRFGNHMLVNGEKEWFLEVDSGSIIRFFLTDAASTRVFNVSIEGHPLKVVGSDSGLYEKEFFSDSITISPGERSIVEVLFDEPGRFKVYHKNPKASYVLGEVVVKGKPNGINRKSFESLREHDFIRKSIDPFRPFFKNPVDWQINLTINMSGIEQAHDMDWMDNGHNLEGMKMEHDMGGMIMDHDMESEKVGHEMPTRMPGMNHSLQNSRNEEESLTLGASGNLNAISEHKEGIEWENSMEMMDAESTSKNTEWIVKDSATGKENMDLAYSVRAGDKKKIRFFNDPNSVHPMQHPMHIHGQRFLVLETDGLKNENLVWKDTVLVPAGSTVDVLVDFSNPGDWMFHCHISEHLEAGMMGVFKVVP